MTGMAGRPRVLPPDRELERMVEAGMTAAQIAERVSVDTGRRVTASSVTSALSRAGISGGRNRYLAEIPWRVQTRHNQSYTVGMLRLLGQRNAGRDLGPVYGPRLDKWLGKLEHAGLVVAYDPETIEGFWFVPGEPYMPGIPVLPYEVEVEFED